MANNPYLKMYRNKKYRRYLLRNVPPTKVGIFGQVPSEPMKNGFNPLLVTWIVSYYRKDPRHGAVTTVPRSVYAQSLLDSCFKNWGSRDGGSS